MTDRTFRAIRFGRALTLGLLASTAFVQPAFAQDTGAAQGPVAQPAPSTAQATEDENDNVIVVTATKREENLQDVPVSIQAIGTKRLDQLNISNFEDYTKQLPSVSYQTAQPGVTVVYMRGVASGGDGNHSGSLPSVGSYLDEQPITTIGGTLDVHIYDIARIESLAGPQGTLYGASSEAGTIRIITNKPELGITAGRVDGEINKVAHGGWGGKLDGMLNIPISDRIALRGVAFYEKDAGFIDNIHGERTYYDDEDFDGDDIPNFTITNDGLEEKNFNDQRIYGGRAALKIDLDDNWTVTPTIFHQNLKADGNFTFDPELGHLNIDRFFDEVRKDKFTQAALTVEGKIADFDITYAGAYLDRKTFTHSDYTDYADQYDQLYAAYGGLGYFYYQDAAGNNIDPAQHIFGTDHFKKLSQELRVASPADKPFRVIAGAFYQRQSNLIHQDYVIDNLDPLLSVNGFPETLWLTQQKRVDKDYALFGEASYDLTPQITLTAGGRLYKFDNTLIGFFGFGRNPTDGGDGPFSGSPPNAAGSNRTGVAQCWTVSGERLFDRDTNTYASDRTLLPPEVSGGPCTNLGDFKNGKVVPKRVKDSGFIHRLNGTWKPNDDLMFYATWSRGFRPGGINRRGDIPPYDADFLSNWELGWKTTLADGRLRWNGAIYHQKWEKFQFSFLGANSFTEIHNGTDAKINGVETDLAYSYEGLSLTASAAYTDAKTSGNICGGVDDTTDDCSLSFISVPSGRRLPITPKFKGAATGRYTWHVFDDAKAHVQAGIAYQGSAPATLRTLIAIVGAPPTIQDPNTWLGKVKGSTVFDLSAGIDWSRWSAELYAANLFDADVELTRGVACGSCMRTLIVPGQPRTIGLRLGAKF